MTEETPGGPAEPNPIGEVFEQLTGPERSIVIGAALIVPLAWLLGDLLVNEYDVVDLSWLLALGCAAGIYAFFTGQRAAWHALYPGIVAVAAVAVALLGVNAFFEDFRSYSQNDITWLFRLAHYAGAGLLGWGGVRLLRRR
jgi:hypothetical protein